MGGIGDNVDLIDLKHVPLRYKSRIMRTYMHNALILFNHVDTKETGAYFF